MASSSSLSNPIASSSRLQPPPSPSRPLLPEIKPTAPYTPPSHPGCVLCGLVASAASQSNSRDSISNSDDGNAPTPRSATPTLSPLSRETPGIPTNALYGDSSSSRVVRIGEREIVYRDREITVYPAVGKERLCSDGRHLIIIINQHVESVYHLGPSDIPLLSHILDTARQFLHTLPAPSSDSENARRPELRVGFVGPTMRDPQIPHTHLHVHAMLGPMDPNLPGAGMWRRKVVFGGLNWWGIEDLRAEIRESTSNNRVKSGYTDRIKTPLDQVPDAGSVSGPANALDPDSYKDRDTSRSNTPIPTSVPMSAGRSEPPTSASTAGSAMDRGKAKAVYEDPYDTVDLGVRS